MGMNTEGWVEWVFRPVVVATMLGAIVLSLTGFIHQLYPAWSPTYLVLVCAVAALEAQYSYRLIHHDVTSMIDPLRFRASELVMLFLLLRLGTSVDRRDAIILGNIPLLDPALVIAFILVLLTWIGSGNVAGDLACIGEPPVPHTFYTPPADRLTHSFFWGGTVLLISAGLARLHMSEILSTSRTSVSGIVLNVLVYFVLGALMLGQIRYAALQRRWRIQGLAVAAGLGARWLHYTLLFMAAVAILAFLLPTDYTLGLLQVLSTAVSVLYDFLSLLVFLILLPFVWILSHLGAISSHSHPIRPAPLYPLPRPPHAGHGASWLELVKSFFSWLLLLAVVVLSALHIARTYLSQYPLARAPLAFLLRLQRAIHRLWFLLGRTMQRRLATVGPILSRLARAHAPEGTPARRYLRLGGLPPREKILYYYLSMLRRAGREGFTRTGAQTPYEYSTRTGSALSEAGTDLDALTQAFVEARYSEHLVQPAQAERVRMHWQRIKDALKRVKRLNRS